MNMFARFDENPAMTLQDIKETIRYVKTVCPPQTKFAGVIMMVPCLVGTYFWNNVHMERA